MDYYQQTPRSVKSDAIQMKCQLESINRISGVQHTPIDLQKIKVIDGITIEVATIGEIPGTFWALIRESGKPTWSTSHSFGKVNIIRISIRKISTEFDTDVWIYAKLSNGENWRCKLELQIEHIECLRGYPTHNL
jgi:hypothetical protein